jgi:sulfide:quinone oxidoreductase
MPSAAVAVAVAVAVAHSISDMIKGATTPTHTASMAEMGAACVASTGAGVSRAPQRP